MSNNNKNKNMGFIIIMRKKYAHENMSLVSPPPYA